MRILVTYLVTVFLLVLGLTLKLNGQSIDQFQNDGKIEQLYLDKKPVAAVSQTARIEGRIRDAETQRTLPGANIMVQGTIIGASADDNGRYVLRNVPTGEQVLRVSFIGYEQKFIDVDLDADERLELNIEMSPQYITGQDIVVTALLGGQARALTDQMRSDNIRNVVASEQLENFPDANLSGSMQRVPGITTIHDRGEPGEVLIRGLSPSFGAVTVNGSRLASTGRDERETSISGIAPDMVTSLEVVKAITPDMDADAISGAINLNTRQNIGRDPIVRANIAGGYNDQSGRANYRAAGTYGARSGNLQYMVSANYSHTNLATEDIRHDDWARMDFGNGEVDVLGQLRPSYYLMERDRYGVTGQIDYDVTSNTTLYVRGMFNRYDDWQERQEFRIEFDRRNQYISQTSAERVRFQRDGREYRRTVDNYNFNVGADTRINDLSMNINAGYTRGSWIEPFRDYYRFRLEEVSASYDLSDRNFVTYTVDSGHDVMDPSLYQFTYHEKRTEDVIGNDYFAQIDFEHPYNFFGNNATVKFGGKFTTSDKSREHFRRRYDYDGNFLMSRISRQDDRNIIGRYPIGISVDWNLGRGIFENERALFEEDMGRTFEESYPTHYDASESIWATYGMTNVQFNRLSIIAGVRIEGVSTDYKAFSVEIDEDGEPVGTPSEVRGDNNYVNLFPQLHFRYRLGQFTNLRLAWTNTYARPEYHLLAPTEFINRDDREFILGNPRLDPLTSMGIDLLFEHYFSEIGMVSAGLFYKDIDNFIFNQRTAISGGNLDGYTQIQPINGESAIVYGLELAWQQQLSFLPGVLSGLGVYANYTYTYSEAEITGLEGRTVRLPDQIPHSANIALFYSIGGFFGQVSLNYQDIMVYEIGSTADQDRIFAPRTNLDISLSQRITPTLRAYAELQNLTNSSNWDYIGSTQYPYRNSFHGWWGNVGLRFQL